MNVTYEIFVKYWLLSSATFFQSISEPKAHLSLDVHHTCPPQCGKTSSSAQEAAAKAGATTPLGAQAEAMYALFDRLGYGGKDFSGVLQMLRGELAGLNLK